MKIADSQLAVEVAETFKTLFHHEPMIVRAPGRVNIIGEHTDYNEGFVLPAAVDKSIYFAIALNGTKSVNLHAIDAESSYSFDLGRWEKSDLQWPDYLIGVVLEFEKAGLKVSEGFDCVFGGDIPLGAGMSSSAALECGLAFALNHFFVFNKSRTELALIAQKAENNFVGVNSGIMDQFASLCGEAGKVLRIDCRSLEYTYFPFEFDDLSIVLCDTGVKHSLASSEYNTRRKQCETGVSVIQKGYPDVKSLRDVDMSQLNEYKPSMDEDDYLKCAYVINEIRRVGKACEALNKGDLKELGALMYATHDGLSRDYEVSCKELDILVDLTREMDQVIGARMMGGGFGGCTINLVKNDFLPVFKEKITKGYKEKTGRDLPIYSNKLMTGVEILHHENI